MRVSGINTYQNNINFGKFDDDRAREIAAGIARDGRLCQGDFNTLNKTDIIHISSKGDTLQGRVNKKPLEDIADKYTRLFWKRATPERLENMQEGYKLGAVATGIEAMLETIDRSLNPKTVKEEPKEERVNEKLQQELDIFFSRAF